MRQFGAFAVVGGIGFAIDGGILALLANGLGFGPYQSRAASFSLAVLTTWCLNRCWTFSAAGVRESARWRYVAVQFLGAGINLGIYSLCIEASDSMRRWPVLALIAGAAIALFWNFRMSRRFVFADSGMQPALNDSNGMNLEVIAEARNYNRFLLRQITDQLQAGDSVVDFGAGIGTFAASVAKHVRELRCVETGASNRERLRELGLNVLGGMESIEDASLDALYAFNVLEHIEDDRAALQGMHAKLRQGGRLLLYVPAFPVLYSGMDARVGHYRRYRIGPLSSLVESAGFAVERREHVDSLGFFAALLYRVGGDESGALNLTLVTFYDSCVFPLSRLVDRLTSGLFGKNILIVARKQAGRSGRGIRGS